MGKIKKARLNKTGENLLDAMALMGLPANTKLTALVIFHCQTRDEDQLAFLCALTPAVFRKRMEDLRALGFLVKDQEGNEVIRIPEFGNLKMPEKKSSLYEQTDQFCTQYIRLWKKRYGNNCHLTAIQRRRVKDLIRSIGGDEAMTRLSAFMTDDDPWLVRNCHPLGVFFSRNNQYHGGQNGKAAGIAEHGAAFDRAVEAFENGNG